MNSGGLHCERSEQKSNINHTSNNPCTKDSFASGDETLRASLKQLDEEYNALDLISETLINSLERVRNEEKILRKALSQSLFDNSKKRLIAGNLTIGNTESQKKRKQDEIFERLESALFESDEDEDDSYHKKVRIEQTKSKKPTLKQNAHIDTKTLEIDLTNESTNLPVGDEQGRSQSEKNNEYLSSSSLSSSSGSEIDEDELLRL